VKVLRCDATRWVLISNRAERASRELESRDATYARWVEASHDCNALTRLWLYVTVRPQAAGAMRELRNVEEMAALVLETDPDVRTLGRWMCLALAGHKTAEGARQHMVAEGLALARARIDWLLNAHSSTDVAEAYAAACGFGDKELAQRIVAEARRLKVLEPAFEK
jgi:hypothetical protein